MKNEQQQQAKHLYFQSSLNKSQIAELLGVNRRTVMLWVQQGNWDRLKMSAQHLPGMVVEKCYYMLNHYLDNLLAANNTISTFGPKEASAINQLATSIKKISKRSAVNESMEMMSFFLDDVRRKDPSMAEAIMPFIEQYIAKRHDTYLADYLPANFNDQGFVIDNEDDIRESWLDQEEQEKIDEDFKAWKMKKAEAAAICHGACPASCGEPVEPREAAGKPVTDPAPPTSEASVNENAATSTSPRKSNQEPYVPANPISGIFKQRESLPKSVEKQLTEHLRNQNKNKVAA